MPAWFNEGGLWLGAWISLLTMWRQRAASREYLRLIFGRNPTLGEVWEHFYEFAKYLALRLEICGERVPQVDFAPGDGDELRAWIASERPALYGTMHVGHSDLVGFSIGNLGERVYMIRKHVGNSLDTERLARRYSEAVTFIWINDWSRLIIAMNEALSAGNSLAMQCDRPEYSSKHEGFQFLGARRKFPFTIYYLSIMYGLPVVLSYAVPHADDATATVVHMLPMFHPQPARTRRENFAEAREHFQGFLDAVEAQLRLTPYQWFNFTPMNPPMSTPSAALASGGGGPSEIGGLAFRQNGRPASGELSCVESER